MKTQETYNIRLGTNTHTSTHKHMETHTIQPPTTTTITTKINPTKITGMNNHWSILQ